MINKTGKKSISSSLTSNKGLKALFGENKNDELFNESGKEDILDMESPTTVDSNDYDEDSNEDNNELESSEDRYDQDYSCKETEDEAKGYGKSVLLHAAESEESSNDDWEVEEDDLLILKSDKHKAKLSKDWYYAQVGEPIAEKQDGEDGKTWVRVTIPFLIKCHNETITVLFRASRNLNPKGRLFPVVAAIMGREPWEGLDLRKLEGKQVRVLIDYYTDAKGNVWEEVVEAEQRVS